MLRLLVFMCLWPIAGACALLNSEEAVIAKTTSAETTLAAEVESAVAPFLAARDFMGVIGISKAGEQSTVYAFGEASIELGVPHTADSVLMIGSVSKQFTAAAILLLEQDGKLATKDMVGAHLPDFTHGDLITIEQLLTHTSGVADIYSLPSFGATRGQADDFDAVIAEIGAQPLLMEPGSRFSYSNGGYAVLAAIVEEVSGMRYGEFMQSRIFAPLGMDSSSDDQQGAAQPGHVSGYDPWGPDALTPAVPVSSAFLRGSGSIWSTAGDMLAWSEGLHGGRVLNEKSYAKLTKDYGNGYGFGVSVFKRFGRDTIGHDGRVAGFSSDLAYYVEDQLTVVVLSNVQSVSRDLIRRQVAAAVLEEEVRQPKPRSFAKPPEDMQSYEGAFSFGPGFVVYTEVFNGPRLLARANEGGWSELIPLEDGAWFSRMLYATVQFEKNERGDVERLLWGAGEGAPVGRRIAESP